jgi:hypothetical protein
MSIFDGSNVPSFDECLSVVFTSREELYLAVCLLFYTFVPLDVVLIYGYLL